MKKLILCALTITFLGLSPESISAKKPVTSSSLSVNGKTDIDNHIAHVYSQLDFQNGEVLSFDAFASAYRGYLNLRNSGKLNNAKSILSVADFTLSSTKQRFWIIDLGSKKILLNDFVAHGQGSGDEFARSFSNTENSHQSSIGFYVTDETYVGKHGTSLRLRGMDEGYNCAAYERAIVVHGADYVTPSFITAQKRLGRSWGCPAVSREVIGKVINYIQDGTCLFVYYPQKNYLAGSTWLNKKIDRLPEDNMLRDLIVPHGAKKEIRYVYAENAQDLNPDSPYYISAEERELRTTLLAMNFGFFMRLLP